MKHTSLLSILLALVLLCMPVLACAETIDLSPIGITLNMPESWYCGTLWQGGSSEVAKTFGLTGETIAAFMNEETMCYMLAVPDTSGTGELQLLSTEGFDIVDLRTISDDMWDTFYQGFMSTFAYETSKSGRFNGESCAFVRVYFEVDGVHAVQYSTNVNGTVYMLQYGSYNGPIDAATKAQLDDIAASMTFLD